MERKALLVSVFGDLAKIYPEFKVFNDKVMFSIDDNKYGTLYLETNYGAAEKFELTISDRSRGVIDQHKEYLSALDAKLTNDPASNFKNQKEVNKVIYNILDFVEMIHGPKAFQLQLVKQSGGRYSPGKSLDDFFKAEKENREFTTYMEDIYISHKEGNGIPEDVNLHTYKNYLVSKGLCNSQLVKDVEKYIEEEMLDTFENPTFDDNPFDDMIMNAEKRSDANNQSFGKEPLKSNNDIPEHY